MPTLLMRLAAPFQAWGTTSRFDERDSQLEPSKSGVLGLICCALGRDRSEPVADLAELRMGVRVDREGTLMRDYQTATGVRTAAGEEKKNRTVVSPRYFLADAVFLVGLEGSAGELLSRVQAALQAPAWPLYLGRKCFPPGEPVFLPDGLRNESLRTALCDYPWLTYPVDASSPPRLRFVFEHESHGAMRLDQPVGPFSQRRFGPRYVVSEVMDVPQ